MEPEPVLESLRNAVAAMPDDVPLRLHLATLLLRAGQRDEAVRHLGAVLQRDPGNGEALAMLTASAEVTGQHPAPSADPPVSSERTVAPAPDSASSAVVPDAAAASPDPADGDPDRGATDPPAGPPDDGTADGAAGEQPGRPGGDDVTASYDWSQAEAELRDVLPSMFVGDAGSTSAGLDEARAYDAEHAGLTLADVAGMTEVKNRLEAAFLAPMRNPELRKLYGKSLRGGPYSSSPPQLAVRALPR